MKKGYYWVKIRETERVTIAQYLGSGVWVVLGYGSYLETEDLFVGEKIKLTKPKP